jgi:hypothetical protein
VSRNETLVGQVSQGVSSAPLPRLSEDIGLSPLGSAGRCHGGSREQPSQTQTCDRGPDCGYSKEQLTTL